MASSVSRTAPETVVTATMLTRLFVAIANIDRAADGGAFDLKTLRFALDGVRLPAMRSPGKMKRVRVRRAFAA